METCGRSTHAIKRRGPPSVKELKVMAAKRREKLYTREESLWRGAVGCNLALETNFQAFRRKKKARKPPFAPNKTKPPGTYCADKIAR